MKQGLAAGNEIYLRDEMYRLPVRCADRPRQTALTFLVTRTTRAQTRSNPLPEGPVSVTPEPNLYKFQSLSLLRFRLYSRLLATIRVIPIYSFTIPRSYSPPDSQSPRSANPTESPSNRP